ncbi:MAG: hypothetical protein COA94_00440 [Rickettsiales bacterium]|nr:MAG: hypothetical protein COA94_00440 [Rickettsiales bacterium]
MLKKLLFCITLILLYPLSCAELQRTGQPSYGASLKAQNDDLEYLGIFSPKVNFDYQAPKLQEMLAKRSSYKNLITRLYLTFIYWDQNRNSIDATNESQELFKMLLAKIPDANYCYSYRSDASTEEMFFRWFINKPFVWHVERYEIFKSADLEGKTYQLPLWLVLKYPQIVKNDAYRKPLKVNTPYKIESLPEFTALESTLKRMTEGRWETTSRITHYASNVNDIGAQHEYIKRYMNINILRILNYNSNHTTEQNLKPIKFWGGKGLWNSLVYKDFVVSFEKTVIALQKFYQSTPYIIGYEQLNRNPLISEQLIRKILSSLVYDYAPIDDSDFGVYMMETGDEKSYYKIMKSVLGSSSSHNSNNSAGLKKADSRASNMFLSRAILNDFSAETIELIIRLYGGVNSCNYSETPLMNAASRPEILRLLIKNGAKIDTVNTFGKTALFYAIQFGDYEAVKILIDHGADVNKALYNLETFNNLSDNYELEQFFMLEYVADFTPLIYAKKYASKDVQNLLLKHKATLGKVDLPLIKEWINKK